MGLKIVGKLTPFLDRHEAGRFLAQALRAQMGGDLLVLGIPRGGVVIGAAVARELAAELDVVIARKLSAPGNPELAIGAVIEGGETYLNRGLISALGADEKYVADEKSRQLERIRQRVEAYRAVRKIAPREGRMVVVVDDGVATGATMIATLAGLRAAKPAQLWCGIPVGPQDTLEELAELADEVVCLAAPEYFQAVGQFYERFDQVGDDEVIRILRNEKGAES
jgi:predicted phosphoribosyltransferase